jgi:hypothetical protein
MNCAIKTTFLLMSDRPANPKAFAKVIATIAKENAIALFSLLNRAITYNRK